MTSPPYGLTAAAEADLRATIRYTRQQWGDAQVRAYMDKLERGIARLAAGQGAFKDLGALYPALRMAYCEHHYIFCLRRENAQPLIVAIFHERMNLMTRLADRLVVPFNIRRADITRGQSNKALPYAGKERCTGGCWSNGIASA